MRQKLATFEHAHRWLRTVAIRESIDAHRRTSRRKTREATRAMSPNADTSADHHLELQDAIAVGLSKLSAEQREAIALVHFEEMTQEDAAKAMGVSRDKVRTHLKKALQELRTVVPVPVVFAAAGTLGIQTALSSAPPVISRARLSELASGAIAKAVTTTWIREAVRIAARTISNPARPLGIASAHAATRPVGVVVAAAVCIGVGFALTRGLNPEPPSLPPLVPMVAGAVVPAVEPLEVRNRRILETETLPRVVEALRPLALNGGPVRVTRLEAHDFRAVFAVEARHQNAPPGVEISRFRIFLDTRTGGCVVHCDPLGRGQFRPIDLNRPIVLLRVPELGINLVMRSEPLDEAVAVLRAFPPDPRATDVATRHANSIRTALASYRGVWRFQGDPAKRSVVEVSLNAGSDDQLLIPGIFGQRRETAFHLFLDPDGRIRLWSQDAPLTLTADGRRIEVPGTQEWWERELSGP
jgi:predicted DNA-binding protein (UPF0251 family)